MAVTEVGAIERLDLRDADGGLRLSRETNWNQTILDWRIFLERGEVFGLRDSDGVVIATAALLPSPPVTWISMVLVAKSHRRRGIGTALLGR